jgi:hypothetical protein
MTIINMFVIQIRSHWILTTLMSRFQFAPFAFDSHIDRSSWFSSADRFPQNIYVDHQYNNQQRIQEFLVMHIVFRNVSSTGGSNTYLYFRQKLDESGEPGHSLSANPSGFRALFTQAITIRMLILNARQGSLLWSEIHFGIHVNDVLLLSASWQNSISGIISPASYTTRNPRNGYIF